MKTITIALVVIFIAGCVGIPTDSSMTSGRSDMRMGQTSSLGNHSVLDNNGQLTLHHGG